MMMTRHAPMLDFARRDRARWAIGTGPGDASGNLSPDRLA